MLLDIYLCFDFHGSSPDVNTLTDTPTPEAPALPMGSFSLRADAIATQTCALAEHIHTLATCAPPWQHASESIPSPILVAGGQLEESTFPSPTEPACHVWRGSSG